LRRIGLALPVLVRSHGRVTGIKVPCQVLRHSRATHLLAAGNSVQEVQRLLGHEDPTTTAPCTKVDIRALAAMIRRCHPRERR